MATPKNKKKQLKPQEKTAALSQSEVTALKVLDARLQSLDVTAEDLLRVVIKMREVAIKEHRQYFEEIASDHDMPPVEGYQLSVNIRERLALYIPEKKQEDGEGAENDR